MIEASNKPGCGGNFSITWDFYAQRFKFLINARRPVEIIRLRNSIERVMNFKSPRAAADSFLRVPVFLWTKRDRHFVNSAADVITDLIGFWMSLTATVAGSSMSLPRGPGLSKQIMFDGSYINRYFAFFTYICIHFFLFSISSLDYRLSHTGKARGWGAGTGSDHPNGPLQVTALESAGAIESRPDVESGGHSAQWDIRLRAGMAKWWVMTWW